MASNRSMLYDPRQRRNTRSWHGLFLASAIVVMTFVVYFPAVSAQYVWDDDVLLYGNPMITASGGLYRFWFTADAADYWPLTSTTFWLEWRLWGDNPLPYHVTNILMHAASAVLLWRILKKLNLGEPGAFLAALIFAIHPVAVASAAWIAERKNVLSMVFYLLSIWAYLRFEDMGRARVYVFALLATVAAFFAKTSVVMLPVILLLLCWWRRQTITRQDIIRTIPFFLLSLVFGLVTLKYHHHIAIADDIVRPEGLASRIASVGWVVWFYLYKIVFPTHLIMIYPRWEIPGDRILSFIPLMLLIACFVVLGYYRKGWGRGPLVALGSFVISLAPVLGLLDMSYARFSLVADHLQYVGLPGVIALIGGGLGVAWSTIRQTHKKAAIGVAVTLFVVIPVVLGVLTWHQAGIYYNEITLWSHTLTLNDRAWMGYCCRGKALAGQNDLTRAIEDFTKAMALKPDEENIYLSRGLAYDNIGDYARAFQDYKRAIELKPDYVDAYCNRGNTFLAIGDYKRAIRDYGQAIELNPDYVTAYHNRAIAHCSLGEYDKAWADVEQCVQLGAKMNPEFIKALTRVSPRPNRNVKTEGSRASGTQGQGKGDEIP